MGVGCGFCPAPCLLQQYTRNNLFSKALLYVRTYHIYHCSVRLVSGAILAYVGTANAAVDIAQLLLVTLAGGQERGHSVSKATATPTHVPHTPPPPPLRPRGVVVQGMGWQRPRPRAGTACGAANVSGSARATLGGGAAGIHSR